MAKQVNPLDALIENVKADRLLLEEKDAILLKAKEEKNEISSRMKDYRKDLSVFIKYATDEQKKQIEELDLDVSESSGGKGALNKYCQIAIDALTEAKGNKMTNGELYGVYVDSVPKDQEARSYSQFNVDLRQIFKRGLVTKKQLDPTKTSRDDIISLVIDKN